LNGRNFTRRASRAAGFFRPVTWPGGRIGPVSGGDDARDAPCSGGKRRGQTPQLCPGPAVFTQ